VTQVIGSADKFALEDTIDDDGIKKSFPAQGETALETAVRRAQVPGLIAAIEGVNPDQEYHHAQPVHHGTEGNIPQNFSLRYQSILPAVKNHTRSGTTSAAVSFRERSYYTVLLMREYPV
jgi:hypothetical protein